MALILSAATGNFNAGATWVGGIVPGAGDEARASTTHTITITANVTCTELSNAGTGTYVLNSGVTLTANVTHKGLTNTVNCLTFSAASPATASIVGNITAGSVTSGIGAANTSTGTLNITGNALGGGNGGIAVNNTSTGIVNITGNTTVGTATNSHGAQNLSSGTLTITGNVTGGGIASTYGAQNSSSGILNIIGTATGGSSTGASGANNASSGVINLTGTATGGSNATAYGANNTSTGQINITGTAIGGTVGAGANNASSGTLNVTRAKGNGFGIGSVGLSAVVGVSSAQASITKVEEIEYGSLGQSPTSGPTYLTSQLTNVAVFVNYPTGTKTLSDPNNTAGLSPAATDVRSGVVYNNGVNTGTCAVPAAASVAFGVPVDNTTGTATLTAADVRAAIGLATANLDTQLADLPTASENADAVWDEATSGHTTSGTYGGRIVRSTNANNELQINAQNHGAANVHQFQTGVITASAFDASVLTAFAVPELQEIHLIHGLKSGSALTVTPSSRAAGAVSQNITGDGTTTTTVTRT
jgi:hypothetical protein